MKTQKSILHLITAFALVVVIQFPQWVQLLHTFKHHDEIHLCSATGATKHIHLSVQDSCSFLHHQINFTFTFEQNNYTVFVKHIHYTIVKRIQSFVRILILPENPLRAPPLF